MMDEKILKLVLENVVSTNINDLLRCRLVNHSWNRVAVEVLEENRFALELDYMKLLKFKVLLWNSQSQVHAENNYLASPTLSLSLNIYNKIHPHFEPEHVNELAKAAQLLILHPQLRVASLKCLVKEFKDAEKYFSGEERFYVLANNELFGLLKLTANDLTSFTLVCDDASLSLLFERFEFDSYLQFLFPKLTSIKYEVCCGKVIHRSISRVDLRHVLSIINSAPKLTKLKLYVWKNDEETAEGSAEALGPLIQASSARLEQLDLLLEEINGLRLLSEIRFPHLTKVKLSSGKCIRITKEFKQFLENHSSILNSLEINFVWSSNELETLAESLEIMIPVLPNVLHFGFYPRFCPTQEHALAVHATFTKMMRKMPNLNLVSFELEVFLSLETHLERAEPQNPEILPEQYPIFPSIWNLEVQVTPDKNKNFGLLYDAKNIFRHIFPSITNLVIVISPNPNELSRASVSSDRSLSDYSEDTNWRNELEVFDAFEFLDCANDGIQTLELRNYTQLWLKYMLQNDYFTGVKNLKLLPSPVEIKGGKCPKCTAELDMLNILTQFSTLEYFQFGRSKIFGPEIESIRNSLKRVEWFKNAAKVRSK